MNYFYTEFPYGITYINNNLEHANLLFNNASLKNCEEKDYALFRSMITDISFTSEGSKKCLRGINFEELNQGIKSILNIQIDYKIKKCRNETIENCKINETVYEQMEKRELSALITFNTFNKRLNLYNYKNPFIYEQSYQIVKLLDKKKSSIEYKMTTIEVISNYDFMNPNDGIKSV